jgi:hypothetical protein
VHRSPERFESGYWANKKLVAFGATNEVVVCSMTPVSEIIKIKRP